MHQKHALIHKVNDQSNIFLEMCYLNEVGCQFTTVAAQMKK